MLSDDEIAELPDDHDEAFLVYEEILWMKIDGNANEDWSLERRYVDSLFAFEEVYETNFLSCFEKSPRNDNEFGPYFREIRSYLEASILKFWLHCRKAQRSGVVTVLHLDGAMRTTIHFHINNIREALNLVDLPEKKRESLFNKLNAFAAELDRNRTKLDAMVSFALEVSAAAGKAAENLKPVRDLLEPLWKSLGKAKEDVQALPAPQRQPRELSGPNKQLPKPEPDPDEIPF